MIESNWYPLDDTDNLKSLPGIYILYCIPNRKYYIGETLNMKRRLYQHINSKTQLIHKAINAHKINNFLYYIEYFPDIIKSDLIIMEEFLIQKYDSLVPNGYNICPKGQDQSGKVVSEETKRKMSEKKKGLFRSLEHQSKINLSNTGKKRTQKMKDARRELLNNRSKDRSVEIGLKISSINTGRICPIETRKKLSESLTGHVVSDETKKKISESRKGKTFSEETKKKMSDAKMGRKLSEETKRKISDTMQYSKQSIND